MKDRLMGFAPTAFAFKMHSVYFPQSLPPVPNRELAQSLARTDGGRGIHRRSNPAAPLSRPAVINFAPTTNNEKAMHPLKKTARASLAQFIYQWSSPRHSLCCMSLANSSCAENAAATANNILAHETMFRLAIIGDLFTHVIFICLGIPRSTGC